MFSLCALHWHWARRRRSPHARLSLSPDAPSPTRTTLPLSLSSLRDSDSSPLPTPSYRATPSSCPIAAAAHWLAPSSQRSRRHRDVVLAVDTDVHSRWLLPPRLCWSPSRRRSLGGSGWRQPRRGWRKTTTRCTSRSASPCRTTRGSSTRTPSRSARPSSSASAPTEDTTVGIGATDEVALSQPPKLPSTRSRHCCRHWGWASTPLSSLPIATEVEWLNHNIQQRIAAPKRTHEAIATSLER